MTYKGKKGITTTHGSSNRAKPAKFARTEPDLHQTSIVRLLKSVRAL